MLCLMVRSTDREKFVVFLGGALLGVLARENYSLPGSELGGHAEWRRSLAVIGGCFVVLLGSAILLGF